MMQKTWKITETLANGYSSESNQRELSNEYQHYRVFMDFRNLCVLVLWTKAGFDLSGCPGGIHALKFVRPTQDWLSFIIWDRPKTDPKNFLKSIPAKVASALEGLGSSSPISGVSFCGEIHTFWLDRNCTWHGGICNMIICLQHWSAYVY